MTYKGTGPAGGGDGAEKQTTGRGSHAVTTLPPVTDQVWQDAAERVNGLFVAVVYVTDGKVRRRAFVTLAAAQAHADRARDRGYECSVVLAELRPCYVLPGVVT